MKPNVEHILTYIKVVECGSFTQAAQILNISKSVVSKHITALETALKIQLLRRQTRQISPTQEGLDYYRQVKTIPEQINNAHAQLQTYLDKPYGNLKVIAPTNFSASLRLEVVPRFLMTYPDVHLQLRFERPVEDYLDEDFDIALMWKFDHIPFPDYPFVSKRLFKMPVGLYATPTYLERYGTPKVPDDLAEHHCLSSISQRWPLRNANGSVIYQVVKGQLETNSDDMIYGVVKNHLAITYAYPFLYARELQEGSIVTLLREYTQSTIEVYAFYHANPYLPQKIKAFIQMLQEYYDRTQQDILALGQL